MEVRLDETADSEPGALISLKYRRGWSELLVPERGRWTVYREITNHQAGGIDRSRTHYSINGRRVSGRDYRHRLNRIGLRQERQETR